MDNGCNFIIMITRTVVDEPLNGLRIGQLDEFQIRGKNGKCRELLTISSCWPKAKKFSYILLEVNLIDSHSGSLPLSLLC